MFGDKWMKTELQVRDPGVQEFKELILSLNLKFQLNYNQIVCLTEKND